MDANDDEDNKGNEWGATRGDSPYIDEDTCPPKCTLSRVTAQTQISRILIDIRNLYDNPNLQAEYFNTSNVERSIDMAKVLSKTHLNRVQMQLQVQSCATDVVVGKEMQF